MIISLKFLIHRYLKVNLKHYLWGLFLSIVAVGVVSIFGGFEIVTNSAWAIPVAGFIAWNILLMPNSLARGNLGCGALAFIWVLNGIFLWDLIALFPHGWSIEHKSVVGVITALVLSSVYLWANNSASMPRVESVTVMFQNVGHDELIFFKPGKLLDHLITDEVKGSMYWDAFISPGGSVSLSIPDALLALGAIRLYDYDLGGYYWVDENSKTRAWPSES